MNWLLNKVASGLIRTGSLKITDAEGKTKHYGDGTGEPVHVVFKTRAAERAVATDPWLELPERFMDEEIDIAEGGVIEFLKIAYANLDNGGAEAFLMKAGDGLRFLFRRLQQLNTTSRARQNVHRHYDLSGEMYELFLDEDRQYSCAYFEAPDVSLDEAQRAKKRHIEAKLDLKPGQKVLDIGSGWGGLGIEIARRFGAEVLGVTLSDEQYAISNARAKEAHLEQRARFELCDYRALTGPFDRIVSVGMFEHVGINHFRTFFEQCERLMKEDGVMLLHFIGRTGGPFVTNAFIRKYIFPGGYIPSLSEVTPVVERTGLIITDVEVLRLHYAETLRHWRQRFMANRDKAKAIYDEKFCRMWEFYLAGSEAAFRWGNLVVFQIQLAKRNDVLPITRDYITDTERALRNGTKSSFTDAAE